jgi:hypothetical protein
MYTSERPAYLAKNRYNLPHELPLSWAALVGAMGTGVAAAQFTPPAAPAANTSAALAAETEKA